VIYDLFTEFGVTAYTEIDFDLDNASPAPGVIKKKCHDIRRKIEDELGAQPYEHIHAICGADFFDDLITHSEVAKAYDRYLDGAFLHQDQARGSFEYSGIVFEEYRGRVGTVDFTDASKAYFFPVGVPGLEFGAVLCRLQGESSHVAKSLFACLGRHLFPCRSAPFGTDRLRLERGDWRLERTDVAELGRHHCGGCPGLLRVQPCPTVCTKSLFQLN
jgi:hypothetical protein